MDGNLKEIFDRLIRLETQMLERWEAHEKRSQEFKEFFKDLIDQKFKALQCTNRKIECDKKFNRIWAFITIIIVSTIGVALKTLWVK